MIYDFLTQLVDRLEELELKVQMQEDVIDSLYLQNQQLFQAIAVLERMSDDY